MREQLGNTLVFLIIPGNYKAIWRVAINPQNPSHVYAMATNTFYESTDYGVTWSNEITVPNASTNFSLWDIEFDPTNGDNVFFSSNELQVYHSSTGLFDDLTLNLVNSTNLNYIRMCVSMGRLYIISFHNVNQSVYIEYSVDGGSTFTQQAHPTTLGWGGYQFEVSPGDYNVIYVGNADYNAGAVAFKSTDGGTNFSAISNYSYAYNGTITHGDIRVIKIIPPYTSGGGNDVVLLGTDGGILKTTNGGTNWTTLNGYGLNITQFHGIAGIEKVPSLIMGGAQDNGLFSTSSGNWTNFLYGDGYDCVIDRVNSQLAYVVDNAGASRLMKTLNGGQTWSNTNNAAGLDGTELPIVVTNDNTIFFARHQVFKSTNQTSSWTQLGTINNPQNHFFTALAVCENNPNIIYAALENPTWSLINSNRLFRSIDGGSSWTDISSQLSAVSWFPITSIEIDPRDPTNHIWVGFGGFGETALGSGVGLDRIVDYNYSVTSGNWTQTDKSNGLREFPVNCIRYQKGTDDGLYIGTDIGVFAWNKNLNTWECFSTNLPTCMVVDLELNYCANFIRASVYGRGVWQSPLAAFTPQPILITTNTTWNGVYNITSDVTVATGSTLTISGANTVVNMLKGHKIRIERGAKLIISGATLTNLCGEMWDGIEVWGDRNAPQFPLNTTVQGQLIINNGATIENAYEGVTVCKTDASGNIDWNYTGGMVFASNSTFKNCGRAVQFLSYRNGTLNNRSYFHNCTFETNGRLDDPSATPSSFISMYDVKGVKILGCTFQNLTPSLYTLNERGSGIISVDAGLYLNDICTSQISPCPASGITHNKFTNLFYGIDASDATPLSSVVVNDCIFTNNNRGAIFRGMDFPVITNNTFDVGVLEINNNGFFLPYGLYLEYCTGYQVENNKFTTSIVGNTQSSGLDIYYSGPEANIFYNNTFDNLEVGTILMENNNDPSPQGDGLLIKCNDYGLSTDNVYDVALTQNGTVAEYQGSNLTPTSPAGNTFSHSCVSTSVDNDFSAPLTTDHILYTCDLTNLADKPQCYSTNTITLASGLPYSKSLSCPPSFANCGIPCIRTNISYNQLQVNQLKALVDGNNTQGLLNTISTGTPGGIQNQLMQYSPYLSDQVLLAAVNRPSPLPPGTIKNIIVANSPVTKTVKDAIDHINLPNGIRNQINSAQTGISARTILESKIAYYSAQRELDVNQMIRTFLTDTTIISGEDSVIAILNSEKRVESKCMLVAAYIQTGQLASANQLLDSLSLAGHEDNFCKLQRYIIELRQDIQGCYKMKTDTVIAKAVTAIAQGVSATPNDPESKDGCANAQALLKLVFGQQFPEIIVLPTKSSARLNQNSYADAASENNVGMKIFPNPTNQISTVEISIPDSIGTVKMVVMDLLGNIIKNYPVNTGKSSVTIQADDYSPGIYLCVLYRDGEIIDMQKLVITK